MISVLSESCRLLRTKCRRLFRRREQEKALELELQFHLDELVAQYRAEGMSEGEARLAARREFGAEAAAYREEIRDTWRPPQLAELWRSLRFAARSLGRSPGFTLLAVVTLGLGIGANTAMFSVMNSVMLKPLPYPENAELDRLDRATPQNLHGRVSPADFIDLQQQAQSYGEIAAYSVQSASLSQPGQPAEMVNAIRVTSNFLTTLRVQTQLGRDFLPKEALPGNDRVVIISRRCWQQRFGGRSDAIGRTIRVEGEPHEIIGVLPEAFNDWRHLGSYDLFRPLALDPEQSTDRRSTFLRLIGRRIRSISQVEANSFIANFGARLATDFPEVNAGSSWRAVPLNSTVVQKDGRSFLAMLIGLSGFVLFIACSNLANLLLARTMARAREFAVRSAIGASPLQLLRPLIAESILLALAGGVCSVMVTQWVTGWLTSRSISPNGERVVFLLDWHVFSWAFAASLVTALAFGLAPGLFALRLDVNESLKSGARGMTGGRGHQRFRHGLIVGQFALAMILLTGAALYIRGLNELTNTRGGWQSEHLVSGTVMLPNAVYNEPEKVNAFHRLALEKLGALPGVAGVSISSFTPFFNWSDVRKYLVEGRELPQAGHEPAAVVNSVTPGYFDTYATRLVAGRAFNQGDTLVSPKVFIISQAMALSLFGTENPIGRRLAQTGAGKPNWGEIVGVAADIKSVMPDPGPVTAQLYQPMAQEPRLSNEIALRTNGVTPASLAPVIRKVMTELDPDLPLRELQAAEVTIEHAGYQSRIVSDILASFALLGLGLASLGMYGVIARTMAQRTGEFAIRFALGARVQDITRIVLSSGVRLAVIGSALGVFGSIGISRVLAAQSPAMHFNSPLVLSVTALLLMAIALLASWLPARRAGLINPINALRAE